MRCQCHCGGEIGVRCMESNVRESFIASDKADTAVCWSVRRMMKAIWGFSSLRFSSTVDRFMKRSGGNSQAVRKASLTCRIGQSYDRKKMAVRTDCIQPDGSIVGAKQAITHYQVLGRYDGFTHRAVGWKPAPTDLSASGIVWAIWW